MGPSKPLAPRRALAPTRFPSFQAGIRESIEKKNQLDSLIYQAEKTIAENEEKLDADDKTALEAALTDAKADLESGDVAKLDAARQRVEGELHKIAEKLYNTESAGAEGMPPNPDADADADAAADDEDVIDAEFTETSSSDSADAKG